MAGVSLMLDFRGPFTRMFKSDSAQRRFEVRVFWPLVTPFVLAILLVAVSAAIVINLSARGQDRIAAEGSRTLVSSLIAGIEEDLNTLVFDNSWWDRTVENLVTNLNKDWADDNIGTYAAELYGLSESFVVAPDGSTRIAYVDGVPSREDARGYFGPNLDLLIARARDASMFEPEPVSGYFMRHGNLHLVAASAITQENPIGAETERRVRYVLVYAQHISMDLLGEISNEFLVEGLAFALAPPSEDLRHPSIPLHGPDGRPVVWLTWEAPQPGAELISSLRLWWGLGVLVVLLLSLLFVRQVLRTARGIADHDRQIAEKDRQLAQSSKLALLGEMAAGVVHELNQPLNIIRMATERTQSKVQAVDNGSEGETIHSQLEIIAGQTERMAETIQSMRIFSRDDYGRKVAFDPALSVAQAIDWLQPEFDQRGVALDLTAPEACGRVFGEPSRFEQVVINLLINARDAVKGGRDDSVTSDRAGIVRVIVSDDPARETVTIEVRDDGPGIPAGDIERVFEPFFTTKGPGSGTGLGLSISYGIVSGMNGTLMVENTGDGALFRIELPRIMPADVAGASAAEMDLE